MENAHAAFDAVREHTGTGPRGLPVLLIALATLALGASGSAAAGGRDLCKLVPADSVGTALHAQLVRVEPPESDPGCEYSIKSTGKSAATDHSISMAKGLNGGQLDPQAQKMMSAFGNAVLGGGESEKKEPPPRHPGEVPVLVFTVSDGNAREEIKLNRQGLGAMSGLRNIDGLGDEAFESSGSMIMVRKGDRLVRFIFTLCNCTGDDVVPVARRIVAAL